MFFAIKRFLRKKNHQKGHPQKSAVCLITVGLLLSFGLGCVGCAGAQRRPMDREKLKEEPTISLYIAETGETKQLKMEEYLQGVVAAEMDPNWPLNALAAQAILARTFTMERIKNTGGVPARGTDASTSVEEFQAYDPKRINDTVVKAVEKTRGEVVKYQGDYIKAWFFADAGGITAASAEEGLAYTKDPSPYVRSVKDPGAALSPPENKVWQAEIPLEKVRAAVQETTGQDPGAISSVKITRRGPSGRAMTVQIGKVSVSAPALRLALGSEVMRSTLLSKFSVANGKLLVAGKGFGHGVGMSQWGARALAEQGKSPEEIIRYFFKGVRIEKEWD
ncbi:MAG TPA: SpoIID/LytB domain-containing protein [Peptococcaceae bacterium]|nr:SpoIID/LytB domain-containing protein [Peptococcaceae bacterium]